MVQYQQQVFLSYVVYSKGTADDQPQNDDLRKHFLRRSGERGPSATSTGEPLPDSSVHHFKEQVRESKLLGSLNTAEQNFFNCFDVSLL